VTLGNRIPRLGRGMNVAEAARRQAAMMAKAVVDNGSRLTPDRARCIGMWERQPSGRYQLRPAIVIDTAQHVPTRTVGG
jgi:hypothetical protein